MQAQLNTESGICQEVLYEFHTIQRYTQKQDLQGLVFLCNMYNGTGQALTGSQWLYRRTSGGVGSHVGSGSLRGSGRLWEAHRDIVGRVMRTRICVCVCACACGVTGGLLSVVLVWGRVSGSGRVSGCLGSLWVSGGTGSGSGRGLVGVWSRSLGVLSGSGLWTGSAGCRKQGLNLSGWVGQDSPHPCVEVEASP